jgi:hypothetical protein
VLGSGGGGGVGHAGGYIREFVKSAVAFHNNRAVPAKPALSIPASPDRAGLLEHFPAKWIPVSREKMLSINNLRVF